MPPAAIQAIPLRSKGNCVALMIFTRVNCGPITINDMLIPTGVTCAALTDDDGVTAAESI